MMAKVSRLAISIYVGIANLCILCTTVFLYAYSKNDEDWYLEILKAQVFHVPVLLQLLLLSLGFGVLVYLLISMVQKAQLSKIEEKIRLLASGHYDNEQLIEPLPHPANELTFSEMDRNISQLRSKLTDLSREVQQLSSRPQLVAGETKEEILTQERNRLARELHDSVSQQLFAAMMMLSALNEQAQKQEALAKYQKQFDLVTGIINAAQSEMRALLLHLRPINLEGKSLRQGIEQLLNELKTKIQITLKWDVEDIKLPNSIEDNLFRIVQEILSNALRHAKADELEVYLHLKDQNVFLRIVDDGVGFDTSVEKAGSYGLTNIKDRVQSMGGTVKTISFVGQGTSVEIKVPLLEEEQDD
jgi:NarL family two-component system sensor histidine kinase LiaS